MPSTIKKSVFIGLILLIAWPSWAATLLDHFFTPGISGDIFIRGNYAYVASGNNSRSLSSVHDELQIIDISDPANLTLVSRLEIQDTSLQGIYVEGDYAYLAGGAGGAHIINVSDPFSPVLIGSYSSSWEPETFGAAGIFVEGEYIYVASESGGLIIIHNDPNDLSEIGSHEISRDYDGYILAKDVLVKDNYAYLAYGNAGLQIFDVSDKANPRSVSELIINPFCFAERIDLKGNLVFLACKGFWGGIQIIDVSDPTEPLPVSVYTVPDDGVESIFAANERLYVAAYTSGLLVLDIRDAASPVLFDSYNTPTQAYDVRFHNGVAYVADGWEGGVLAIRPQNNSTSLKKKKKYTVHFGTKGCSRVRFSCLCEGRWGFGTGGHDLDQCTSTTWLSWYYTNHPREACAEMWNPADPNARIYQESVQCTVDWSCLDNCILK